MQIRRIGPAVMLLLSSCIHVPETPELLTGPATNQTIEALNPKSLRVASWNLHKAKHTRLPSDLADRLSSFDLLLLQEAVASRKVHDTLNEASHQWQMVSAFSVAGLQRGVMTTAKVAPVSQKPLVTFEPLFPLPKSALVTRYRIKGQQQLLAVANLHGINFTIGTTRFQSQLDAVAKELNQHNGPIIFGGDFNAWSPKRHGVLYDIMDQLGLQALEPDPDNRRMAFGKPLDHVFVRGLKVLEILSPKVESSDHNPILMHLRIDPPTVRATKTL